MSATAPFWERGDVVEMFAGRPVDHRVAAQAARYAAPGRVRVLDVGCAGGRNAVHLARRGFDVLAVDSSAAMTAATRERLQALGPGVTARVETAPMDALPTETGSRDWVIALGILSCAATWAEWERAVAECARVLVPGGLLTVASFTNAFRPAAGPLVPVPGGPWMFEGMGSGHSVLMPAAVHDRQLTRFGFRPAEPTATVHREDGEGGERVTLNAVYRRVGSKLPLG